MLTYLSANYRQLNPLEFDNRSILQAANILLGKSDTDALLKKKGPKGSLLLLGALDDEAERVRRNPERPLPEDAHPKNAETQKVLAEEILQWRQLHLNGTQEIQLPYRLRGENQRRALFENRVTMTKSEEGTNAQVQICLAELKQTIEAAEKTGSCVVKVNLALEDAEFLRASVGDAKVGLFFQDELSERPETKRAWLGNVARRCEEKAKAEGTLPGDELGKIAATFSGKRVALAKGGAIKRAEITATEGTQATVEIEVELPEISKLIEEKPDGGIGAITDGSLRLHAGIAHGCNGRDFVASAPEIVAALWKNAEEATAVWLGKETPTRENVAEFLNEYAATALTMRTRLRPKNRLEPAKTRVAELGDILPGPDSAPEYVYGMETIQDVEPTGASCPASAGSEWTSALAKEEMDSAWKNETAETYEAMLAERFGIKGTLAKSRLIHANFLGESTDGKDPLDGGPKSVELESFYMTETMEEEFQKVKEERDQEIFDSKAETATDEKSGAKKEEIIKSEWLENQGTLLLGLAAEGGALHRLKRYNNRRTGLGVTRTKAEWLDATISMPRRNSVRWEGKPLKIEDFLGKEALEEYVGVKQTGDEWEQGDLKEIEGLIADWQSSLRRLDPVGKNPLERRIREWMEAVAEGKPEAKCESLHELKTIFGPCVRAAGKIPYEREKTPDNLQMPVRSSALPLKLLCGTGFEELKTVRENPAELWDMTMRWQCASRVQEEALPEREETRLKMLETALQGETGTDIVAHAVAMEVVEKPNTLKAYLGSIGLENGIQSLPPELADFGDLIHPIKASPRTAQIKGEETSLEDLAEILSQEGIPTEASASEKKEEAEAVEVALKTWRQEMADVIGNLEKAESPTGQDATISIILAPEERAPEEGKKDAFEAALDVLYTTMPQSRDGVGAIAEALLTHSPKTLRVETGRRETVLRRGSGGTWTPEAGSPEESARVAERVNEIEAAMNKKADDPTVDEETWKAIGAAATRAHGARIVTNVGKITPALETLPEVVAKRHGINEIVEPLRLLADQMETSVNAKKLAESILKEWKSDAGSSPWGWSGEMTLNPMGSIEMTCRKIMGEAGPAGAEAKQRNYYATKLIGEKEKIEAAEILAKEGKTAAANFLEEVMDRNMAAIQASANQNMPGLLNSLRERLGDIVARSYKPEIVEQIKTGPMGTLITDRTKYGILRKKITTLATELAKTKGVTRSGKTETADQVGRDILPGGGTREPVLIKVDGTGTKVATNKVWAQGWLRSERGTRNVQRRINALNWLKASGMPPKAGLAFMSFCRLRMLGGVTSAIESGNMTPKEKEAVKAGLEKFTKALGRLGINPSKHGLRTTLLGAAALHQYSEARFARKNPWDREWEKPLEDITGREPAEKMLVVTYDKGIKDGTKIRSPYKASELKDSDTVEETETGRKRMKSAARAVAALYKPVVM